MSLDPGAARAILDACDTLRAEGEAMLMRLTRCPSTLGNEHSALNEMARIYEGLGLAPQRAILFDADGQRLPALLEIREHALG